MKRFALVLFGLLFVGTCHAVAGGKPPPAVPPKAAQVIAENLYCPTDPPEHFAQLKLDAQQGCVALHRDQVKRARVFSDPSTFANVCPILVQTSSKDGKCIKNVQVPDIQTGGRIHLDYFTGTYQLTIVNPDGALVSHVALTPQAVTLGTGAQQVKGYAWLQGSNGSLVYYVYMDDKRAEAGKPETDRNYVIEIFDANDDNCRDDAPDRSATARRDCAPTILSTPSPMRQGGTSTGGEPPPTQRP